MRGPGISPSAVALRSGISAVEPTLRTVVKPAISVTHAFGAIEQAISAGVRPRLPLLPSLPKLHAMCTWGSIQPGRTVSPRKS